MGIVVEYFDMPKIMFCKNISKFFKKIRLKKFEMYIFKDYLKYILKNYIIFKIKTDFLINFIIFYE